ncbi:MAG: T9SS type A sorting domain-containing protein, partial [Bacteroidia bacterium]
QNEMISSFDIDSLGGLWVVSSVGRLAKFQNNTWTVIPQVPQASFVFCYKGYVYVGEGGYVKKYDGVNFTMLNSPAPITLLLKSDALGNAWFLQGSSLYAFDGTNITYTSTNGYSCSQNPHYAFNQDLNGDKWFGCNLLQKKSGSVWTNYNLNQWDIFKNNEMQSLGIDAQNQVWVGGSGPSGLYRSNGVNWEVFNNTNSGIIYGGNITACALDYNNDTWIAYGSPHQTPVAKTDGNSWVHYNLGVPVSAAVKDLIVDKQNRVWVLRDGYNFLFYDGIGWNNQPLNNGMGASIYPRIMTADNTGGIWAVSGVNTLFHFIGGFVNLPFPFSDEIVRIKTDAANNLWVLSNTFIYQYDGNAWSIVAETQSLNLTSWDDILFDEVNNNIWFLASEAFIKYTPNGVQIFKLPGEGHFKYDRTKKSRLMLDNAQNMWVIGDNGVFVFNPNGVFTSPTAQLQTYTQLSGNIFYDENNNGLKEPSELGLLSQKVKIQPLNSVAYTNILGNYYLYVQPNTYQASFIPYNATWALTSDSSVYHVTAGNQLVNNLNFGTKPLNPKDSFVINIDNTSLLCWQQSNLLIHYHNVGNTPRNIEITVMLDSVTAYLNASPSPISQVNNTLTFQIQNVLPLQAGTISIALTLPGPNGSTWPLPPLTHSASLSYQTVNGWVSAASDSLSGVVLCSYDPNDKTCFPQGEHLGNYTLLNTPLKYVIRFQNTGNAPAHNILITDTLDMDLDWESFYFIGASHQVEVSVSEAGLVQFYFPNIMLPDSNADEPGSHGLLSYEIRPKANVTNYTHVTNTAYIFFDYNPAIVTNTTHNILVDNLSSVGNDALHTQMNVKLYPNPVAHSLSIEVEKFKENYEFLLFNANGQLISKHQLSEAKTEVDMTKYPKGFYFYQIKNTEHFLSGKLIHE